MNASAKGAGAVAVWVVLLGCGLFRPRQPDPPPPVDYEGCSDDHDTYWKPAEQAEIWGEETPADHACNEIGFFDGGGFQGGNVFHFEPRLTLKFPEKHQPTAVTYEVYALDGNVVTTLGYEVFPTFNDLENGTYTNQPELRVDAEWRGKNLRVVAFTSFLDENSNEYEVTTEAAFYLSHPY